MPHSKMKQLSLLAEKVVSKARKRSDRGGTGWSTASPIEGDRPMFDEDNTPIVDDPDLDRIVAEHTALDEAKAQSEPESIDEPEETTEVASIEPDLFGEPTRANGKRYCFYEFKVRRLRSREVQTIYISACSEKDAHGTLRVSPDYKHGDTPVWTGRTKLVPDIGDMCMLRDGDYKVVKVREKIIRDASDDTPEIRAVAATREKLREDRRKRAVQARTRKSHGNSRRTPARKAA